MKFQKTLLSLSLSLLAVEAHSAAFQLNETSASGLGRAFAGDAVIADDASVVARNPAAMSLFSKKSFSIAGTYIDPGVDIKGVSAPDILGANFDVNSLDANSVVPSAFIPAIYFINPINDKFAYGLAINSNFGLSSEYDNDYAAGSIGGKTELITINTNLSGSYRINEQFSVGLGLNVVYGEAELVRHAGATGERLGIPSTTEVTKMEGDDVSFGWNIGAVYEVNDAHRFALTYRSEVALDLEGEFTGLGSATEDGSLSIDLPQVAEFSGFHQLTDKFAMHYSVMYTDWSSFDKLEAYTDEEEPVFIKEENFESTYRLALGTTYNFSEKLILRAGVAFDESAAVEDHRSISIPDSDRLWYSVGATYQFNADNSVDLGFAYIDGEKVTVTESDGLLEALPPIFGNDDWQFESEGNAILLSVQYNKSF
ncbi:outer membrane protein transport protein [Colwelliaceae bacterium BS250]